LSIELFVKGLVVGLAIAAPVGPIGLLCIQRALAGGWISGLASGLGAALADTLYGGVAAFGLTLVQAFLFGHRAAIATVGGICLCLLGLRIILAEPSRAAARPRRTAAGLAGDVVGIFMLTLANPLTILSFIAIFAALNTSAAGDSYGAAATLVLGVFCGSAGWWLCLSFGIGVVRHKMDEPVLRRISRVSGALILAFGITAAWHGVMR
jgi:threonine/homoserine/homoserine lactone efflux protein